MAKKTDNIRHDCNGRATPSVYLWHQLANYISKIPYLYPEKITLMAQRDPRYEVVQMMIQAGRVRRFRDIFKYIAKTRVANDLGMKGDRWNEKAEDLAQFGIRELQMIAFFIGVNRRVIIDLVLEEMDEKDKIKKDA